VVDINLSSIRISWPKDSLTIVQHSTTRGWPLNRERLRLCSDVDLSRARKIWFSPRPIVLYNNRSRGLPKASAVTVMGDALVPRRFRRGTISVCLIRSYSGTRVLLPRVCTICCNIVVA
jgi:hypothetical protein